MTENLPKIVAVDFDGTLCEDRFPDIGEPIQEHVDLVTFLASRGVRVILWTCRNGKHLTEAATWCRDHGIVFDAINENIPEVQALFGGDTRKVYADLYLDDKNRDAMSILEWVRRVVEC